MVIINEKDFKSEIEKGVVLVDFYADWCGPCRMLAPVLETAEKELNIEIKKVNVDNCENISREFGIMTIPTLILFKNGVEVKRHSGFLNLEEIKEFARI